jgi:hypothetical protein
MHRCSQCGTVDGSVALYANVNAGLEQGQHFLCGPCHARLSEWIELRRLPEWRARAAEGRKDGARIVGGVAA